MKRNLVIEIISGLLILLFVYAAVGKLLEYETFFGQLSKSPLISKFAAIAVWSLPIVEILVGLLLVFKPTRLLGLYASLFLMTLFTAYIYAIMHYSYYIPCSCGGIISKMSWTQHFWFNVFFVVVSIIGIIIIENKRKRIGKRNLWFTRFYHTYTLV